VFDVWAALGTTELPHIVALSLTVSFSATAVAGAEQVGLGPIVQAHSYAFISTMRGANPNTIRALPEDAKAAADLHRRLAGLVWLLLDFAAAFTAGANRVALTASAGTVEDRRWRP
jgi:hypothetical protein